MNSVDLKSVSIDFSKNAPGKSGYARVNLKQQKNSNMMQKDNILGGRSLAHIDKNPLTNER